MPKLKLISLSCTTTEDSGGADEPYLRVNGQNVWGPISLNDGQSATINQLIDFTKTAEIQLFDQDLGVWFDTDDHLGSVTANLGQLGQGEQKGKFTGDGANYTLVWEVLLDARDGMLVKGSGHPIYIIQGGQRRHIPNPSTFNKMGLDWNAVLIIPDSVLNTISAGPPMPSL